MIRGLFLEYAAIDANGLDSLPQSLLVLYRCETLVAGGPFNVLLYNASRLIVPRIVVPMDE